MVTVRVSEQASTQSKFKVRDLLSLANPQRAYLSPLAVIAHIDVNAFFAQVEQIRLGLSKEDPVVCVQWFSLIAVSYAAREYGISRMDTLDSAKVKCPNIIPAHTAVFKKGENFWRYRDEDKQLPSPVDYKVSLDPYRRESRKIMKIFKDECDLVEKASVDESFMDLGRLLLQRLYEMIPGFQEQVESMDKQDSLPPVPRDIEIEAQGVVMDATNEGGVPTIYDWDDLLILMGSVITHEIRQRIEKELGYTTSCGVAKVKTVAKLASGFKKPDNQTIVRNRAVPMFLSNFDFTDFWSMGGKTGEYIKTKLSPPSGADSTNYIRENYDLHELEEYLEDKQLAEKLYLMVRGDYAAPLSERIVLKSMNSSKNLRGNSGASYADACQWLKVFAADLVQRISETDDENGYTTRAKTISLHFRSTRDFTNPHSKQSPLPIVPLDQLEGTLYQYGCSLLKMCETSFGNIYPLSNINLTISNFENDDGLTTSIMGFVKKGDANSAFKNFDSKATDAPPPQVQPKPLVKKPVEKEEVKEFEECGDGKFKCLRCDSVVTDVAEHRDFHYALDMSEAINGSESLTNELRMISRKQKKLSYAEMRMLERSRTPTDRVGKKTSGKKASRVTKGQSRLPF